MFTAPLRIFLASFLVLFLEVALIRWLPAQIRLLSYFSNFILLAAFLGIGIGALLAKGVKQMAAELGVDPEEAAHVKGLEFPMHDPRAYQGAFHHLRALPQG